MWKDSRGERVGEARGREVESSQVHGDGEEAASQVREMGKVKVPLVEEAVPDSPQWSPTRPTRSKSQCSVRFPPSLRLHLVYPDADAGGRRGADPSGSRPATVLSSYGPRRHSGRPALP